MNEKTEQELQEIIAALADISAGNLMRRLPYRPKSAKRLPAPGPPLTAVNSQPTNKCGRSGTSMAYEAALYPRRPCIES